MLARKREKIIAGILGLIVLGMVADQYGVEPYLASWNSVNAQADKLKREVETADRMMANRARVENQWRGKLEGGLASDVSDAETQALHAIRDFAQSAKVSLVSLKPDRAGRLLAPDGKPTDFMQIRIQATAAGSTSAAAGFLHSLETARIPLKVNDLRINSRKEGTDDLAIAMNVSTLYFSPAPETRSARTPARGEAR